MNEIPAGATVCQGDGMSRRSQLVAVVTALVVLAGCQRPGTPVATASVTSDADSCNHPPDTGGGDPGLGAGFDYTDEHHDFGDPAPMALCMYVPRGSVHVAGSAEHITVAPGAFPGPGRTRFDVTVTVTSGPAGRLDFELVGDTGKASAHFQGPAIQTDATGWYFGAEHEPTG
jgi:hypothetical protein